MSHSHIVKRESGFIAGWFTQDQVDSGYVEQFVAECNANVPADPAHLERIPEWPVCEHGVAVPVDCPDCPEGVAISQERMAERRLAVEDERGAPYVIPTWDPAGKQIPVDYWMALAVARSKHPSRVVAITSVYRYARFTEITEVPGGVPVVAVHLFGQHIATYRPEGVQLWSRGYRTTSTSEALGNLVSGGYFYHDKGVLIFSAYESTGSHRTGQPHTEGATYPYVRRTA